MWMHPEKYLVYSEVRNLTYTTHSPEETEKLGEAIAQRLSGGEVLALFGGMGKMCIRDRVKVIPDLSTDRKAVERFVAQLNRNFVSYDNFMDLLEDFMGGDEW